MLTNMLIDLSKASDAPYRALFELMFLRSNADMWHKAGNGDAKLHPGGIHIIYLKLLQIVSSVSQLPLGNGLPSGLVSMLVSFPNSIIDGACATVAG